MSELRQDLIGGDWIIVASERAKRPHDIIKKKPARKPTPKRDCPFEHLQATGNWPPVAAYPNEKNWETVIIPNKYPALRRSTRLAARTRQGPYTVVEGIGNHELVVTRDHAKNIADLSAGKAGKVFELLQAHYRSLAKDPSLVYTSTFFNWGPTAGASLYHPHYQVLSLPIIPPHIKHSLLGSERYFKAHARCVHCDVLRHEMKVKKRVLAENSAAAAVMSFVSPQPFGFTIFPKRHISSFEKTPSKSTAGIVAVLQQTLKKMKRRLRDPDFNFFIHTAPLKHPEQYRHYHWHIEVVPKLAIAAGFELSTGIDINIVDPDLAAAYLRS